MSNALANTIHQMYDQGSATYGGIDVPDTPSSNVYPLSIALTTPGRIGFYVDYSELSAAGTHTFYICRTHGTAGAVGVTYTTSGDAHTVVTGTLSWANGDASIKAISVPVSAGNLTTHNGLGDHRVLMTLSSATGSAVLHHAAKTFAYGVISSTSMVASNANAVFFDADAGSNGSGTLASPYDNIYDAISNVGSKRYIYGKGTTIPDGTNTANPNGGGGTANCITAKISRSGESTRLYIQAWPGSSFIVDGTGVTTMGFYADGGMNNITYRGIDFTDLDSSSAAFCENGGIQSWKNASESINAEYCTADSIDGSTNSAGILNCQYVDSFKLWRCTGTSTTINGSKNQNAAALCLYYDSDKGSVQRCEGSLSGPALYYKRPAVGDSTPITRFNYLHGCDIGIDYGFASASNNSDYGIVQSNVFKTMAAYYAIWDRGSAAGAAGKNLVANNVFDDADQFSNGCLQLQDTYDYQMFNNIFINSDRVWAVQQNKSSNSDTSRNVLEYADYNLTFNIANATEYRYLGTYYADAGAVATASSNAVCANDVSGNPLFTDAGNQDYTLGGASPALTGGIGGTVQGLYFTGIEVIGA